MDFGCVFRAQATAQHVSPLAHVGQSLGYLVHCHLCFTSLISEITIFQGVDRSQQRAPFREVDQRQEDSLPRPSHPNAMALSARPLLAIHLIFAMHNTVRKAAVGENPSVICHSKMMRMAIRIKIVRIPKVIIIATIVIIIITIMMMPQPEYYTFTFQFNMPRFPAGDYAPLVLP